MPDYRNPRILITRLSAIGDCILTVPLLCALRDHLPGAYLAWAVARSAAPLLTGHAALDELITLDRNWLRSPAKLCHLRRRLRQGRFDICIDPQSLTKSAVIGRLSGAPRRIGLGGVHGREVSRWLNNELVEPRAPHVVDRTLELLRPIGIDQPAVRFDLPDYPADATAMDDFLCQSNISGSPAVINVGASWPSKLWPAERFAVVARHLGESHNLPSLIVWAGDEEHQWAQTVIAACPQHAVLAPRTSLCELAALARRAKLLISSDTGPLHLAAAVDTPCVGLYGPTRPEICGPYGPSHVALQAFYQDGSHRERRRAENKAMMAISTDDVCGACDGLLSQSQADRVAAA